MIQSIPRALLLLGTTLANAEPSFQRIEGKPETLRSPAIHEASGLACSPTDPSFLWIINDSGGTNKIHLTNTDGSLRGSVSIEGAVNKDWEDLASFSFRGKPHLLIADTGDNAAQRGSYTLYIVREPALPTDGKSLAGAIPLAWKRIFTLPGGVSADIESVAVDEKAGEILILTKRIKPAILFSIPLSPQITATIAEQVSKVIIKAPALPLVPFRNQPTGLDLASDSSTAAVITYYGIFLFHKKESETWQQAFSKRPESLGAHSLTQAESVAFSRDGKNLFAISEGVNSPIIHWRAVD